MSNKIALATIQFRADAKGANAALDSLKNNADNARRTMKEMQDALDRGIKTMKDANGIEFDVATKFRNAEKDARSFEKAIRELIKGATALETVVGNIRMGEIEKSSRAELKGAINAAEARKRSVRETDPEDLQIQRELNLVIEESRKQLNNLDRDTEEVIKTIKEGGEVAQYVLDKELKGLKDILTMIPKGTEEYEKYAAQLQEIEGIVTNIKRQDLGETAKILGDINLGKYNETQIREALDAARELIKTYETGSTDAQLMAQYIVRAEEHLKNYGVEAERAARKEAAAQEEAKRKIQEKMDLMTQRMSNLSALTNGGLEETKKFWEAQLVGAEKGSDAAKLYEAHIEAIVKEQEKLRAEETEKTAQGVFGNLNTMSESEIRKSIDAAREYQKTLSLTDEKYKDLSNAIVNAEEYIKKYGIEAERAARKEAAAQEEAARKLQEKQDMMEQRMQNLGKLTNEGLQETKKFWEAQLVGAERGSDAAMRYENYIKTITAEQEHLQRMQYKAGAEKLLNTDGMISEGEMRAAIEDAKKYLQTLSLVDKQYKEIAGAIAGAEEFLKRYGLEAERSAMQADIKMKEMTERMKQLPNLSDAALQETKKFWEEQRDGAIRGSKEAQTYEKYIEAIANKQTLIAAERNYQDASKIFGNLNIMSESEITAAINAAREYQKTLKITGDDYQRMSDAIVNAEEHIKNYGIEAERAARKEAEAQAEANRKLQEKMDLMTNRMQDVTKLTDASLAETKKYWEAQLVGIERDSDAAKTYMGYIEQINEEQQRLINAQNKKTAMGLFGNLNTMSEGETRKAIEAAREYQKTLSVTDGEYQRLSHAIVNAEEHIKKYGIEAERAARKEVAAAQEAARKRQETDALMRQQLEQGWRLSKTALKAQEQYWRKLIDDPKTAAESIREYEEELSKVHAYQQLMIRDEGQRALTFFTKGYSADATGDEIAKQAEALKAYKGTLNVTTDAGDIAEIDRILKSLKDDTDAAKGSLMSFTEALEVLDKISFDVEDKLNFDGTTEDLIGAKNALEKELATVERGSARYDELREKVDLVNKAIENTRINQKQVDAILKDPKHASYDQLKMAIDASRKRLNSMRRDTEEQRKAFDELAKSIKEADIQMKNLGNSSKGTAGTFEKAWSRLKTYVTLYVGAAAAMQRISSTINDLMELSDKLGEVRKTTGFTADEVGRLSDNLRKLDTRTSITGLLDLSVAAGQLGLKTEQDVQGFTEAANKLMVALPEMGQEGATQMLKVALATGEIDKIRKEMEQGLIEGSSATAIAMEKVGSTIDRLRATSAATAPAITDFVKRVGAVGAQSGISIDQIAALGSTVDALGLRVEMSATALSRMIPAIRNNAFDVAKAIGVTPESLRNLFDTGRGMEAILMIFQHIKDAGMDEDSIEKMLGMGNMKEIMKELNQQGARAGIVFAGLSQNVDELRKHLGTASQAYRENIAIQMEYDKMNETTMARWERLKNQLEEAFVSDSMQRFLGWIVDRLRGLIDLLTGDGGVTIALKTILIYLGMIKVQLVSLAAGALKAIGGGLKNIGIMLGFIKGEMTKIQWGNVFTAAAAAVIYLVSAIKDLIQQLHIVDQISEEALSKAAYEIGEAKEKVDNLFESIGQARVAIADTSAEVKKAQDAVDKAKKSLDGSRESTEKLEKAETNLKIAKEKSTTANNAHAESIRTLNQMYSPYLGYMLSEISSATELANARELINAKLRETILLKQKESAYSRIEGEFGGKRDKKRSNLYDVINDAVTDPEKAARVRTDLNNLIKKYRDNENVFANPASPIIQELKTVLGKYKLGLKTSQYLDIESAFGSLFLNEKDIAKARKVIDEDFAAEVKAARTGTLNTKGTQQELREQLKAIDEGDKGRNNGLKQLEDQYKKADAKSRKKIAASLLQQMDAYESLLNNSKNYFDLKEKDEAASYQTLIQNGDKRMAELRKQRETLVKEAGKEYKRIQETSVVPGGKTKPEETEGNLWGSKPSADSTDYGTWDVDELVARRNQMDKFKNILKPDTDVKAVLAEDKALMKALQNGLSSDWKSVMNWYNQERLKIQEELKSERFSTNQGHWRDEKNGRGRRNRFRESDYALAELDRYYSKRKEELEKARVDENMSEELFNRQAELLEQEHLERRSKLRETFTAGETKEEQEMVKKFREWWENLEKQGLLDDVPWKTVESEWSKALASDIGRNNLKAQQDLTQLQQITVKHLNKIADIIAKERPYDGIVDNLRKNLTEMDILLGDIQKQGPTADPATLVQEQNKRLQFLLGEAETAYQSTIDDVLRRMADAGMTAWADEIGKSDAMKNALMAQLQKAYDEIQNAIKKEASDIKKQTDIWWNDLVPGQDQSRKGVFEKALSQLGLKEDQVKRANQLIGAGAASERVADKLAVKQMQLRLQMQQVYYDKMRQMWADRIAALRAQGKEIDAQHAEISKQLSLAEEQKKLDEQRVAIANQLEESQNRLYTTLREWATLLSSSVQSLMEASHAGDADYYNERAKLNLTGKGGPGAGTYIVIDNEGTSDATAHYEYLDEREALERQHEIERQNAQAEAWRKVMDDINQKMNEQITDWINAMVQNQSVDANTQAVMANTQAIYASMGKAAAETKAKTPAESDIYMSEDKIAASMTGMGGEISDADAALEREMFYAQQKMELSDKVTEHLIQNDKKQKDSTVSTNSVETKSTQSMFSKMAFAANAYGIAYQAMSNDNLSTTQKFEMMALQAVGNYAISALTTEMAAASAKAATDSPGVLGTLWKQLGWAAAPVFAIFTGLLGGLMGLASSKIGKAKSQIAQATGASASVGRLTTGMMTYAEGNVNEFSDPASLTPGRSYNVDAADGKTYRAKYTGKNPSTHLTNGPEFHLAGEKGREMIIDAGTTRQITMNENEIWQAIKTLSGGGRITSSRRRGKGVHAFAEGNVEDFDTATTENQTADMGFDPVAMKDSIDKNNELLDRALTEGIKGVFNVYGPDGLVASYDKGKKNANRHGEKY